jgi:DNA-binding MurR/RpiR family transcriptional regulator
VSKDRSLRLPAQLDAWRKKHEYILRYINEHDELSYKQMAVQIGVSRSTVVQVAKAAHITRPPGRKLRLKLPTDPKAGSDS